MHHTVRQSRIYHSYTHKISENTTIKTNSDTNIMLKDSQNSITSQRINMSSRVIYNGECMHVKLSEKTMPKS